MTGVKKNFLKLTLDKSHFITERRYYEYRVMALEKLNLSKVSANELTEYKKIISQLIKGDDTDKQTKTYYFYMLNKQFEDD